MTDFSELHQYDFLAPRKIVFGWGRREEVALLGRSLGNRAFLVCGSKSLQANGQIAALQKSLEEAGIECVELATIGHEPEIADVDETTIRLRECSPTADDFVLGVGGGSAIDLAKAVAAMATNQESETVQDYLEGIGKGLQFTEPPLPVLAMPTTAGTGSEATKNAVISSTEARVKKSLRSELMIPQIVLIDPELSISVPPSVTANTGMDAITQLIESYISCRSKPITDALCLQGLQLAIPALLVAVNDGTSREARESMAHAAFLSGMALANSGLGMAHGVAAALGIHAQVPHGLACAVMLPATLRTNCKTSQEKLAHIARLVNDDCPPNDEEASAFLVERIETLCRDVGIPASLGELGVREDQLPDIVSSSRGNSMSGNPRDLSDEELREVLGEML